MTTLEKEYTRIENDWKYPKIEDYLYHSVLYKMKQGLAHGIEILFNGVHLSENRLYKSFVFKGNLYGEEIAYKEKTE